MARSIWLVATKRVGVLSIHPEILRSSLQRLLIACPVCNKIVVALLGVSSALAYFEPVQPLLGAAGIALLAVGVLVRLGSAAQCQVPVLSAKV